ncbi:MAG: hypothetical protein OXC66_00090, partial [Roseovarius sp.]|nr:hypothetical protein [Roseovarius sp.]
RERKCPIWATDSLDIMILQVAHISLKFRNTEPIAKLLDYGGKCMHYFLISSSCMITPRIQQLIIGKDRGAIFAPSDFQDIG